MLTPSLILKAYQAGVFPMSEHREDKEVFWVRPETRGIFPLDNFHIPKSVKRLIRNSNWYVTVNQDFNQVIQHCAEVRTSDRQDSWINYNIQHVFQKLHQQKYAHSFETRDEKGNLVGGLYGLAINGAFFGESMFSLQSGGSKFALIACYYYLLQRRFKVFDTQFNNPHLKLFGCIDISYQEYDILLKDALAQDISFLEPLPTYRMDLKKLI